MEGVKKNSEEPIKWYVLRAIFKKEIEVRDDLRAKGIECFVPMHYVIREKQGRKVRVLVPAIRELVFVRSTKTLLKEYKNNARSIVYFMTAKEGDGRKIIVVPPRQMDEFIRIAAIFANTTAKEEYASPQSTARHLIANVRNV